MSSSPNAEGLDGQGRHEVLPFVFSLFLFVLISNLFGMVPGFFTVGSQIIVTFALAFW